MQTTETSLRPKSGSSLHTESKTSLRGAFTGALAKVKATKQSRSRWIDEIASSLSLSLRYSE